MTAARNRLTVVKRATAGKVVSQANARAILAGMGTGLSHLPIEMVWEKVTSMFMFVYADYHT